MRSEHSIFRVAVILGCGILLAACAKQPPITVNGAPGFGLGFIHGVTSPVAIVASFFTTEVRIYAFPNSGWGYDFGYMIGIAVLCAAASNGGFERGRKEGIAAIERDTEIRLTDPKVISQMGGASERYSKRTTNRYVFIVLAAAAIAAIITAIWQFWPPLIWR